MTYLTDAADIKAAIEARRNPTVDVPSLQVATENITRTVPAIKSDYRFVRPLAGQADDALIETIRNPEGRWMFGLPELDTRIRGVGPGEMALVVGYSHTGKSQLFLQSILNNRDRNVQLFTPDETAELVLMKLVCMLHGLDAEALEYRLKNGDTEAETIVRNAARNHFRNLLVIDEPLTVQDMSIALEEARAYWQDEPAVVGVDYLNMVPGIDTIEGKAEALKQWCKGERVPLVVVHQGGRGSSGKGEPITMTSGKFGGEQEANFLIGVRRKRDDQSLDEWERRRHDNTVALSIVKNKRPPSKRTPEEGIDHFLCPTSGLIRPLRDTDFPDYRPENRQQAAAPDWRGEQQGMAV